MNTTILLIVCVILLIVGISLTIYFVTKGKSEKPAPSDKKSESKPGAPGVPVTTPWLTQAHNNIVGNKRFLIQNSASGKYITLNDVRDYKNISFTTSDISKATVFDSGRTVSLLACVDTNAGVAEVGAISKSLSV